MIIKKNLVRKEKKLLRFKSQKRAAKTQYLRISKHSDKIEAAFTQICTYPCIKKVNRHLDLIPYSHKYKVAVYKSWYKVGNIFSEAIQIVNGLDL